MTITVVPGTVASPDGDAFEAADAAGDPAGLLPGTRVEVRRRFDDKWARGFEVERSADQVYWLRRVSDGVPLPVPFVPNDVRCENLHTSRW